METATNNEFEKKINPPKNTGLYADGIETIQVNVGLKCNQQCRHCHVEASPFRNEMLDWPTMELIVAAAQLPGLRLIDITGGAPELNPHLPQFIRSLRQLALRVQMRTNLTALLEVGLDNWSRFLRDHQVELVASMPCYLEENVTAQRGAGVYQKSIEVIRHLNTLGYGVDNALVLNLVYNPGGPSLPAEQSALEADYRRRLHESFGISFTKLLTITNMPIGRFQDQLHRQNQLHAYMRLLQKSFNPQTVPGLMCRHQLNIGFDGVLYDCDFNLALHLPVDHGAPNHIKEFDPARLRQRRIVTGNHCFGCTAGCGSSCDGALV
jgi:radical SAM/Cys-rich protein